MFTFTPDSEMPQRSAASAMLCPSSFTATMEHRIFSGSRCMSCSRSRVLSALRLSSCHHGIGLVDRYVVKRGAGPTQEVDQLVASDCMYPRRQRLGGIIG